MRSLSVASAKIRHRLLEGVLLRLARRPEAAEVVLRGGMLLRQWFRPLPRPAQDVDLVGPGPLRRADAERFLPLFADETVNDGVRFDVEGMRVASIWEQTAHPGLRFQVMGQWGEGEADIQVDITGGPAVHPPAEWGELPTACGQVLRLRMCAPEHIIGQKIQALVHMNVYRWRPKDLLDLWLLLRREPPNRDRLREAVQALLAEVGSRGAEARALWAPDSWLHWKMASARWDDVAASFQPLGAPQEMAVVVAEVRERLASYLEGLP
jgi:hypothetical protein